MAYQEIISRTVKPLQAVPTAPGPPPSRPAAAAAAAATSAWQVQPAGVQYTPTDIFKSEEIREYHSNVWQRFLSPKDIQKFELSTAAESGTSFQHDDLASYAVMQRNSEWAEELLAISLEGLRHKGEDIDRKLAAARKATDRQRFIETRTCVDIALLNGQVRSFWKRNSSEKLVEVDVGIVRFDGGTRIYIINEETGRETPHDADEREWVKRDIDFRKPAPDTSFDTDTDSESNISLDEGNNVGIGNGAVGKGEHKIRGGEEEEEKKGKGKKGKKGNGEKENGEKGNEVNIESLSEEVKNELVRKILERSGFSLALLEGKKK